MTLQDLCNMGNTPAKPLEIINPYTEEKTGVTLYVHQVKSRKGSEAQSALNIKYLTLMADEENVEEIEGKKRLKQSIIEDISREMFASLIESWDGIDDEFSLDSAIELLNNSSEIAIQVANFANQSGKSLKKSAKGS